MRTIRTKSVHVERRFVLVVIESVESYGNTSHEGYAFSALVEPVALVVCAPDSTRALDMSGKPVDIGALGQDFPALDIELRNYVQSLDVER